MENNNKFRIFLKGLLMGTCDIIPGISAGTIAFITGIYERLINAIKGFSLVLLWDIILYIIGRGRNKNLRGDIKKLDLGFLLPLLTGILFAIFALSRVISFLLEHYFSYTMIFFVGLILASGKTIFDHIEKHHSANMIYGVFGLAIGISLMWIVPAEINPNIYYVFLGGFLAISAMMLPGISGSFILLILGIYGFMLEVLHNLVDRIEFFIAFIVGAIVGLFTISRVISFLFRKNKSKTLYFLLGLVIGSLGVPLSEIIEAGRFAGGEIIGHILLFGAGVFSAVYVSRLARS